MTDDDKLAEISYEVDDFISHMLTKYKMDPLTMSSVIVARLMLVNQYAGSDGDFRKLIENIPHIKPRDFGAIH